MNKFIYVCVITFLAFQTNTYAQNTQLSADSVTKLLCKKWEIDYAVVDGKKVEMPSNNPQLIVEFFKGGTFSITGGEPDHVGKGTWNYNTAQGTISMLIEGKDHKEIMLLTKDQFAILSDDPASTPPDPRKISMKAKVYFKVKQ